MTIRIYQAQPFKENTNITLDEAASHHLARVLRVSVGEEIRLFNGKGGEFSAIIQQINKKNVQIEIKKHIDREVESSLDIWLAQGISRGEKMDLTIQKAVELGVKKIIPLFSERCNVKLDQDRSLKRLEHWRSIVMSACEQSGRNRLPELEMPQALDRWLPTVQADFRLILSPYAENTLKKLAVSSTARVVVLIGPEGGLSDLEISQAVGQGFLPLNLGPRVLRTETAGLAVIAALQGFYGDMG
ncbi:MAG TPA: 16S rRNA (uracil(1498)-N(3))-methyltransferase [Gammaproteobacteria bacterium]|nr:16S rRNA (uracil(1498)-N(3))-methyltransferase [Gammaproteobacteria bacterium]